MRLTTALCLLAVPGLYAAAPSMSSDDMAGLIAVARGSSRPPAFALTLIDEGAVAWKEGRILDARNAWLRADAWFSRTLPVGHPSRAAIERLSREANESSRPKPTPAPVEAPISTESKPRRRVRKPAEAVAPVSARSVMESARAAKGAGELEKAARLMRIASELPGGDGAVAEAEALEREAFQPAR